MTREEAIKYITNTKVYVKDKGKEIQKKVLSLGFHWDGEEDSAIHDSGAPFYYLKENNILEPDYDIIEFNNSEFREISPSDILSLIIDDSSNLIGYRPFISKKECYEELLKHKPFGYVKDLNTDIKVISAIHLYRVKIDDYVQSFREAFSTVTFLDGEPFGIKTKNAPEVIFNKTWHNPKEGQPRYHSWFLGQIGDDAYETFFMELDKNETWDKWSRGNNIKRWAYIDELLPKAKTE